MEETTVTTLAAETTEAATETHEVFQKAVQSVGEEMEHASSIVADFFTPFKNMLPSLIVAAFVAFIGYILIKYVLKIVKKALQGSNMGSIAAGFLTSVIRIILFVMLAVIVLSVLNVPMDSIVAVIASAGVAVGLALKDSLSNLAGGFILLFAKPVKEGDVVEIDGSVGKVEQVDILYTTITTPDNAVAYVPNGKVSTSKIINYTARDTRRLELHTGISYTADIETAKQVLMEMLNKHPLVLKTPEPQIYVKAHGDSAVELLMWAWCKSSDYWGAYYGVLEQAKLALDENGIEIPFQQVVVHTAKE